MKFSPNEDFKHGFATFEAGNTYDSEKQGLTDVEVRSFHANGWAEVEGMDPAPERQVRGAIIEVNQSAHAQEAEEV